MKLSIVVHFDALICCSSCFLIKSNGFDEYSFDCAILLKISIFVWLKIRKKKYKLKIMTSFTFDDFSRTEKELVCEYFSCLSWLNVVLQDMIQSDPVNSRIHVSYH